MNTIIVLPIGRKSNRNSWNVYKRRRIFERKAEKLHLATIYGFTSKKFMNLSFSAIFSPFYL